MKFVSDWGENKKTFKSDIFQDVLFIVTFAYEEFIEGPRYAEE